jgi:hypothetical protein
LIHKNLIAEVSRIINQFEKSGSVVYQWFYGETAMTVKPSFGSGPPFKINFEKKINIGEY